MKSQEWIRKVNVGGWTDDSVSEAIDANNIYKKSGELY